MEKKDLWSPRKPPCRAGGQLGPFELGAGPPSGQDHSPRSQESVDSPLEESGWMGMATPMALTDHTDPPPPTGHDLRPTPCKPPTC